MSTGVCMSDIEALADTATWPAAFARLDRAGTAAVDLAIKGIAHPSAEVRKWSAALLDHHGDERCVTALVAALDDPIAAVRRHALHSLGCQTCKQSPLCVDATGHLIRLAMKDDSVRVRRAAAHMLGNQPADARAAAALADILSTSGDHKLRRIAEWSMARHQNAA
jgi:HEAT repeat protein